MRRICSGRQFLTASISAFAFLFSIPGWSSQVVPGEFLVQIKQRYFFDIQTLLTKLSTEPATLVSKSGVYLIKRPSIERTEGSLQILSKYKEISVVEANHYWRLRRHPPQDPKFEKLWGLYNTGQEAVGDMPPMIGVSGVDIDALKAWDITTGDKNVKVAVIDTGVDYNHPDLKENIWVNEVELHGKAGVDDDNNGCIDDIHGCNFVKKNGDPMDDDGHGTHVAGTIGAVGDNNIGIAGVAWHVTLIPIKFIDDKDNGTTEDAIRSIDYAIEVGAQILSNSWGDEVGSELLKQAIERAKQAGALFVVAAGNETKDNDVKMDYPSGYDIDNIISVAAVDNTGDLASFSNYGKKTVHIAAPGYNVYSTYRDPKQPNLDYESFAGTSMACPHVSGVAVLLLAQNPKLTYQQIRKTIFDSARPMPKLQGKVSTGGMLNAYEALKQSP